MKNDNEYDGVIYEPSSGSGGQNPNNQRRANRGTSSQGSPRTSNGVTRRPQSKTAYYDSERNPGRNRPARPPVKKKSNFAIFYVFTLFTGIMVCIVIFTIFFSNFSKELNKNAKLVVSPSPVPTPTEIVINEMKQVLGVIDSIDIKTGSMHLLDVSASTYYDLYYDSSTELTNKFGQIAVFSEFKVGDMVDANFNPKTSRLKSLSLSSQSWEYKQVKNVKVDALGGTVTIGNDVYDFDENLVVTYGTETYPIHSVKEYDLLTIRGYRSKVASIVVNKSHGSVEIVNKDYVKNGYVEINTDMYIDLASADYIELQEGIHRVVVKGANIEPYIKEISLGPKENIRIDLNEAEYKTGLLFINANVTGYVVVINDQQVSSDEAITLDYGSYTVRLEKTDYETWQKDVNINAPRVDVNAIMSAVVKMGKITINTSPSGAQLYIDGKLMGSTPFDAMVEQGTHTISAQMHGYTDPGITVDVTDEHVIYNITLHPVTIEAQTTVTAAPAE